MKPIKVFFYHNGNTAVSHYRVWSPAKYLKRMEGFQVKRLPDETDRVFIPMEGESNVPGIGSHDSITAENDVLFSGYSASYREMIRLVCQASIKPVIIDIDDDIFNIETSNPGYKSWHAMDGKTDTIIELDAEKIKSPDWIETAKNMDGTFVQKDGKWYLVGPNNRLIENTIDQLKNAALVTTSTERLKQMYSKYNPNIEVIPNAIDFEWWPKNNKKNDGFVRLGLFGSNSHYRDWREIADTLVKILKDFPKVKLCFISWFTVKPKPGQSMEEMEKKPQFPDFFETLGLIDHPQVEIYEGVDVQYWPKALADIGVDIGLAPLKTSAFNRGKSNLKYLEFSALRVPGVYEKFDPYENDVKHGQTGFLASHSGDWYSCIKRLVEDEDLRKVMGNRAWQDVKNRYDQKDVTEKLANLIRLTVSKGVIKHEENIGTRAARSGLVLAR